MTAPGDGSRDESENDPAESNREPLLPEGDSDDRPEQVSDEAGRETRLGSRTHEFDRHRSSSGGVDGPSPQKSAADENGDTWHLFTRDILTSVLAVALLGMYLFAISGVWPPMVAIESESMEPNMNVNDLVFLMDTDRFQPGDAHPETGVVAADVGAETGYGNYGDSGDVVVFEPDGNENTTPIIHRVMFWVDEGENWCERANETGGSAYLGGLDADDDRCVAPNDGFITKGDNNNQFDQASPTQADRPVKPEWIIGTAELRVPRLGWFRLQF